MHTVAKNALKRTGWMSQELSVDTHPTQCGNSASEEGGGESMAQGWHVVFSDDFTTVANNYSALFADPAYSSKWVAIPSINAGPEMVASGD